MNANIFWPRSSEKNKVSMPHGYARRVAWQPQIGDLFPDFTVQTTHGELRFFDWAEGSWTVLFSYPAANTPVCTTEMASLAAARTEFGKLNVQALGLTGSTLDEQRGWQADIQRLFGVEVFFPCAEDPDNEISRSFGMLHGKASGQMPIRKTFILDPSLRIRAIQEYPMSIGRNTEETLRIIQALQAQDALGVATPADWFPGDVFLLPLNATDVDCVTHLGHVPSRLTPYLATVEIDDVGAVTGTLPGPERATR